MRQIIAMLARLTDLSFVSDDAVASFKEFSGVRNERWASMIPCTMGQALALFNRTVQERKGVVTPAPHQVLP